MLPDIFNCLTHIITIKDRKYLTKYCKTIVRQYTLAYVGPTIWNTFIIQNSLQDCISTYRLKKSIKHLLMCSELTLVYTYAILDFLLMVLFITTVLYIQIVSHYN